MHNRRVAPAKFNLVQGLSNASASKQLLERRLVQMALGVMAALQKGEMSFDDARLEFFNTDNYLAVKRHKLSRELREFFELGMELEDVADLAPGGLSESYWRVRQIATRVMRQAADNPRRRSA